MQNYWEKFTIRVTFDTDVGYGRSIVYNNLVISTDVWPDGCCSRMAFCILDIQMHKGEGTDSLPFCCFESGGRYSKRCYHIFTLAGAYASGPKYFIVNLFQYLWRVNAINILSGFLGRLIAISLTLRMIKSIYVLDVNSSIKVNNRNALNANKQWLVTRVIHFKD